MSVEMKEISKLYADVVALDDVSVSIKRHSFTTLLGPSGSGKSTLLMCMAGFTLPTSGRIEVDGREVTSLLPEDRGFGVVFQGYALFPHMTVWQNIAFPLRMRRISATEIASRVDRMLELVKLGPLARRRPSQLSGGQQQRVALARALAFEPEIVLLDEPLSALDRALREDLRSEIKRIHNETGATFLMVTHDQEEALSMSDRVVVLNNGRIEQQGPPAEIYNRPSTLFVANFVGMTNITDIVVQDFHASPDGCAVSCRARNGAAFSVNKHDGYAVRAGARLQLSVRPEAIGFCGPYDSNRPNRLPGTVASHSFEGFDRIVSVKTDLGLYKARVRSGVDCSGFRPGEDVTLTWSEDAGHLIEAN